VAVTERSRHNVHKYFEESMGEELAATLMEMLPGVGWADVARRRDLDDLRVSTTQDVERLRDWASVRFDSLETSMVTHPQLNRHTFVLIAAMAAVMTIVTTVSRLL
jgi:hypothetical protein